jgi:hypothetical protein
VRRLECERESDVLDAIAADRWPGRLERDLADHVSRCHLCQDLGTVAQAFADDRDLAPGEVRLPSAGLVWWRAEIRAKQQATQTANRPITFAQAAAAAGGLGAALALLSQIDPSSLRRFAVETWTQLGPDQSLFYLLYAAAAIFLVLTPLALYLVLSDE